LIFKLVSKGDKLKVKLANLKISETGDGRLFLVFGGRLVGFGITVELRKGYVKISGLRQKDMHFWIPA